MTGTRIALVFALAMPGLPGAEPPAPGLPPVEGEAAPAGKPLPTAARILMSRQARVGDEALAAGKPTAALEAYYAAWNVDVPFAAGDRLWRAETMLPRFAALAKKNPAARDVLVNIRNNEENGLLDPARKADDPTTLYFANYHLGTPGESIAFLKRLAAKPDLKPRTRAALAAYCFDELYAAREFALAGSCISNLPAFGVSLLRRCQDARGKCDATDRLLAELRALRAFQILRDTSRPDDAMAVAKALAEFDPDLAPRLEKDQLETIIRDLENRAAALAPQRGSQ